MNQVSSCHEWRLEKNKTKHAAKNCPNCLKQKVRFKIISIVPPPTNEAKSKEETNSVVQGWRTYGTGQNVFGTAYIKVLNKKY